MSELHLFCNDHDIVKAIKGLISLSLEQWLPFVQLMGLPWSVFSRCVLGFVCVSCFGGAF